MFYNNHVRNRNRVNSILVIYTELAKKCYSVYKYQIAIITQIINQTNRAETKRMMTINFSTYNNRKTISISK